MREEEIRFAARDRTNIQAQGLLSRDAKEKKNCVVASIENVVRVA